MLPAKFCEKTTSGFGHETWTMLKVDSKDKNNSPPPDQLGETWLVLI